MNRESPGFSRGECQKAVEAAVMSLEGQSVESFIDSGAEIVTSENVEEYIESMQEIGVWE